MVRQFAQKAHDTLHAESEQMATLLALVKKKGPLYPLDKFTLGIAVSQVEEVERETCYEHIAAHRIGMRIMSELGLLWDDVALELDQYKGDWTCPGEPVDLMFLLPDDARDN
jgi:hypothetical protein